MKGFNSVYIASRYPIVIKGFKAMIANLPPFKLLGHSSSTVDSYQFITQHQPDIAMLDFNLNDGEGIQMLEDLMKANVKTKLCVLTDGNNQEAFHRAMQIGLNGFLLFDISEDQLSFSLREILKGSIYVSPSASEFVSNGKAMHKHKLQVFEKLENLSKAEFRVLNQVSKKLSNREIANQLFLSTKTIENHRNKIVKRLGLKGGHHSLFAWALENKKEIALHHSKQEANKVHLEK